MKWLILLVLALTGCGEKQDGESRNLKPKSQIGESCTVDLDSAVAGLRGMRFSDPEAAKNQIGAVIGGEILWQGCTGTDLKRLAQVLDQRLRLECSLVECEIK